MKKNRTKNQEKSHRLNLNRETLRFLDNPNLLELARGGKVSDTQVEPESTSQDSFARC